MWSGHLTFGMSGSSNRSSDCGGAGLTGLGVEQRTAGYVSSSFGSILVLGWEGGGVANETRNEVRLLPDSALGDFTFLSQSDEDLLSVRFRHVLHI